MLGEIFLKKERFLKLSFKISFPSKSSGTR